MGELIVSVVASTMIGLVSIQARRYQFWRAWVKRLFWGGLGAYLLINAILGALAVSLAHALDWHPVDDNTLWNGLIIAAAAQGAIRVELPRVLSENLETGGSILRHLVAFVIDLLNGESEKAIQHRLEDLADKELVGLALYLHSLYVKGDDQLPEPTRAVLLQEVTEAGNQVVLPAQRDAARGTLEHFCLRQFITRDLRPVARLNDAS